MAEAPDQPKSVAMQIKRDVPGIYANNVRFEGNVWDLRILFGQLDRDSAGEAMIDWRAGVTVPWPLVKILVFFLSTNLYGHEEAQGFLKVPASQIPKIAPLSDDATGADKAFYQYALRLHKELFGETS